MSKVSESFLVTTVLYNYCDPEERGKKENFVDVSNQNFIFKFANFQICQLPYVCKNLIQNGTATTYC